MAASSRAVWTAHSAPASRRSSTAWPCSRRPATGSASTASRAARPPRPSAGPLPPVFHVAGTNGKGSTCAFLRAALEAARAQGPRLHQPAPRPLQRAHPGRRPADRRRAARRAARPKSSTPATGIEPSFFEVATAAALLAFARTPADACILEVGLGGRLDATNVIERPLVTRHRQPRPRPPAVPRATA